MTQREKKFVFFGVILAVILFGYFFGYQGYREYRIEKEQLILEKSSLLAQDQAKVKEKKSLERGLTRMKTRLAQVENSLFPGDSPNLAAAEMQKLINQIALDCNIELKTIKPLSEIDHKSFTGLPLQLNFRDNIEKVLDFLYEIETIETFLVISELTIRVINEKNPETVDVRLKLSGFMKGAEETGLQ